MGASQDAASGTNRDDVDESTDDPTDDAAASAGDEENQLEALGRYIRDRREKAELSMRELAKRADISNPYLSQIERGLHEPSVRVITSIASALNESAEVLLRSAGMLGDTGESDDRVDVARAIRDDDRLTDDQQAALLTVYESYLDQNAK